MIRIQLIVVILVMCGALIADAASESNWRKRFDRVISLTSDSMGLEVDDLRSLLTECAELEKEIDALNQPEKRIRQKRLSLACNLYRFVLESKLDAKSGEDNAPSN